MGKGLDKIRSDPRVREAYKDSDGLWVSLKAGWQCDPETHLFRGDNLRDIRDQMRYVRPCSCRQCRKA